MKPNLFPRACGLAALAFILPLLVHAQAPHITVQPQSQSALAGSNVSFTVSATGKAPLSYYWSFNGGRLSDNGHITGASTATLAIAAVLAADVGSYQVLVSNRQGTALSAPATLSVLFWPAISGMPNQQSFLGQAVPAVPFTIGDMQTPAANLSLSGSSSNPSLVPNQNIVFGGAGSNRTVTVTPAAGVKGAATITVTVFNSLGLSNSSAFVLTVTGFTDINAALPGFGGGSAAWGDYDGDGRLDILLNGMDSSSGNFATRLFHNEGSGVFSDSGAALGALSGGAAVWGDYNNDGRLDVLLTGVSTNNASSWRIYRNDGANSFALVAAPFTNTLPAGSSRFMCAAWGDYDNDGKLDALFNGWPGSGLFRNAGSDTFTNVGANLPSGSYSWVAWGDYDNDGRLDFVESEGAPGATHLYHNEGGGNFTLSATTLPGVYAGTLAWGDYDNDGRLDLALTGMSNNVPVTCICHNDGNGNFTPVLQLAVGSYGGSVAWGDYDSDGRLDLLVAWQNGTVVLHNNGDGTFSDIQAGLPGISGGMAVWGDYDNDGRLDILLSGYNSQGVAITKVFHNDCPVTNTPPGAPSALSVSAYGKSTVLSWAPATDAQQSGGLSYNLRVGTQPGGIDVCGPMADPRSGYRRVPALGNAGLGQSYTLSNLCAGTYYWSVQAVDHAWAGSLFVAEQSFTISAPVITNSPVSQTALIGSTAQFTVGASGTAPLVYHWYRNGSPLPSATTSQLFLGPVQTNMAGNYMAVVTNAFGVATSAVAMLTVPVPPAISQQPEDQWAAVGTYVFLTASATGSPLEYQWYFEGVPLTNSTYVSGANSPVLGLAAVDMNDSGNYWLVVTNLAGTATSQVAHLSVQVPPSILSAPTSQVSLLRSNASFAVQADGSQPLFYQWFRNGVALVNDSHLTGASGTNLLISPVQGADGGTYTVVVSNAVGVVVAPAVTLTVLFPPSVSTPASQTVLVTSNASFTATPAGTPPLYYQWFKDEAPLSDGGRFTGANTTNLTIGGVQVDDAGGYWLVVSNAYGVASSGAAQLTVLVPPSLSAQPASQIVVLGSNATFSVQATGTQPLSYQWLYNGTRLTDDNRWSGCTTASLTVSNVQFGSMGTYAVTVTNLGGSVTSTGAVLTVMQPPGITSQPVGCSLPVGLPVSFSVTASGSDPLSYQWQLNGSDIPGATNVTYSIGAAGLADFGVYQVVVSNAVGVAVSVPAPLTVGTVYGWGRNDTGQTVVPPGLSNVVMTVAGMTHSLALKADGTLAVWGGNSYGQTNLPANPGPIVAVAAGYYHNLALKADGTVLAWGYNNYNQATVPTGLSNVVAVAAGAYHSLALRADGMVVTWGYNGYGQSSVPVGLRKVVAVAAGGYHSLALRADGTVAVWGSNVNGEGTLPAGLANIVALAAGFNHNLALRADGTLVAWGFNTSGQTNVPAGLSNVVAVAAGESHSLAFRADGTLAVWGYNGYGQTNTPAALSNVVAVSTRAFHNLAMVGDGRPRLAQQPVGGTFCVGRSVLLQAQATGAVPLTYQWRRDGVDLPGATNASLLLPSLAASDQGNYQVLVTNALGAARSLPVPLTVLNGVGPFVLSPLPTAQTNDFSSRVTLGMSIGGCGPLQYQWWFNGQPLPGATNEELVLDPAVTTNSGQYVVSVRNSFGSIFVPADSLTVVQVKVWGYPYGLYTPPLAASNATAIAISGYQYIVARPDGKVVTWGTRDGQWSMPTWVSNVVAVAAGNSHYVALRSDGTVVSWGTTEIGVTNVPAGLNSVVAIAAGTQHTLALRADGTVVAWGNNAYGQSAVPSGISNVVAIAAGAQYSLALRADGTIVGWGYNNYGQVNGPPPNIGNSNFVAIAAGVYHSLGLRADGTVATWGQNNNGTLNVPAGLSNVVAFAAGTSHSVALCADGTVVPWGIYYQGPATAPADLVAPNPACTIAVASSGDHSMALFGTRAPYVTVPPFNRTVVRGTNTTLVAKVVGPQPVGYQWQFNGVPITGATTDSLRLNGLRTVQSGAYQLVATNAYGAGSAVAKVMVTIPLAEALDTTNLAWSTSGNAPWYGQDDTTFDGSAAGRSGGIGNGQESLLQTTVIGPGRVNYWWKVSSEEDFDLLEFRINGVRQTAISGEVGWQQQSVVVPAGTQTLQWRYTKDGSYSDGQDAGWVDQVVFIPDPPLLTAQPASLSANAGANVSWMVAATGTPPLSYQWFKDGSGLTGATGSSLTLSNVTRRTGGSYAVQVSNGGGATLSSNAVLKVLVPQLLGPPTLLKDGSLVLASGDADGGLLTSNDLAHFQALVSTNLTDWVLLPGALSVTNGQLQLQDPGRVDSPSRFYRIVEW